MVAEADGRRVVDVVIPARPRAAGFVDLRRPLRNRPLGRRPFGNRALGGDGLMRRGR